MVSLCMPLVWHWGFRHQRLSELQFAIDPCFGRSPFHCVVSLLSDFGTRFVHIYLSAGSQAWPPSLQMAAKSSAASDAGQSAQGSASAASSNRARPKAMHKVKSKFKCKAKAKTKAAKPLKRAVGGVCKCKMCAASSKDLLA